MRGLLALLAGCAGGLLLGFLLVEITLGQVRLGEIALGAISEHDLGVVLLRHDVSFIW
jgi:hypothetical protein